MFVRIDGTVFLQMSVIIILLTIGSNGDRNQFCNNLNHISNIFNLGPIVYITQGLTSTWKFDTRAVEFNNIEKQTFSGIFGTDDFDSVDGVFSFAFAVCSASPEKCVEPEAARNLLIAIGHRKAPKGYGYVTYKFEPDFSLSNVNKNWTHKWGLTAEGTLTTDFWPKSFKQNGTLIIGTGFSANERNLYIAVNQIDENKKPLYLIYTRNFSPDYVWSEWTATNGEKINGMFTFRGDLYVVDSNSEIKTYKSSKAGSIEMKKSVSAKEFFNCSKNSTLLRFRSLNDNSENDFSEYKESAPNSKQDAANVTVGVSTTGSSADVSSAPSNDVSGVPSIDVSELQTPEDGSEPNEDSTEGEKVSETEEPPAEVQEVTASAIESGNVDKLSASSCLIVFSLLFCFKIYI